MGVEVIKDIHDKVPVFIAEKQGRKIVDEGVRQDPATSVAVFVYQPPAAERLQTTPTALTMLIVDLPGPGGDTTNRRSADDFPAL